jgi:predicted membrane protein
MMKNWFFTSAFWGLIVVVIGILYLARNLFGIDFPIWGIIWPVIIIFIGLSILLPKRDCCSSSHEAIFDEVNKKGDQNKENYRAVFGSGRFDISDLKPTSNAEPIELEATFGSLEIVINENQPIKIISNGIFGAVNLPSGESAAFSEVIYTTKSYDGKKDHFLIRARAVFGEIKIIDKK